MIRKSTFGRYQCVVAFATTLPLVTGTTAIADHRGVPFIASFAGSAQFSSETTAVFQGYGTGTHLGWATNSGAIVIVGPSDENGCLPNINTETLIAANGDQVVLEMIDIACPLAPPAPIFHGTGNWHVIAGTGRFADVTGSGVVDGTGDFMSGTFQFTITGHLEGIGLE
jgi:hypothetical protein